MVLYYWEDMYWNVKEKELSLAQCSAWFWHGFACSRYLLLFPQGHVSVSVVHVAMLSWYALSLSDRGGCMIVRMGWSPWSGVRSWVYASVFDLGNVYTYWSVSLGCVWWFCDMYCCDHVGLCSYLGFLMVFSHYWCIGWVINCFHNMYDMALEYTKYSWEGGFIHVFRLNASLFIILGHVEMKKKKVQAAKEHILNI